MASPALVGVGATGSGGNANPSADAPAGVGSTDFQICPISGATGSESITAVPSGWALLGEIDTASPTSPDRAGSSTAWLYTSATAGSAVATWTKDGTRIWQAVRAAWSGVTGVGEIGTPAASSATTTHPIPSVTPTANKDCTVVAVAICDAASADAITFDPPAGFIEHYDVRTDTGAESEIIAIASIQVAGSATPSAVTGSFTSNAIEEVATFSLVLEGDDVPSDVTATPSPALVALTGQDPIALTGVTALPGVAGIGVAVLDAVAEDRSAQAFICQDLNGAIAGAVSYVGEVDAVSYGAAVAGGLAYGVDEVSAVLHGASGVRVCGR